MLQAVAWRLFHVFLIEVQNLPENSERIQKA